MARTTPGRLQKMRTAAMRKLKPLTSSTTTSRGSRGHKTRSHGYHCTRRDGDRRVQLRRAAEDWRLDRIAGRTGCGNHVRSRQGCSSCDRRLSRHLRTAAWRQSRSAGSSLFGAIRDRIADSARGKSSGPNSTTAINRRPVIDADKLMTSRSFVTPNPSGFASERNSTGCPMSLNAHRFVSSGCSRSWTDFRPAKASSAKRRHFSRSTLGREGQRKLGFSAARTGRNVRIFFTPPPSPALRAQAKSASSRMAGSRGKGCRRLPRRERSSRGASHLASAAICECAAAFCRSGEPAPTGSQLSRSRAAAQGRSNWSVSCRNTITKVIHSQELWLFAGLQPRL